MRIFPSADWLAEAMTGKNTDNRRHLPDAVRRLLWMILLPFYVVALAFYLASLMVVFLPLYLAYYLLFGVFLYLAVWWRWCAHGRCVLFVYSDSPIWHDYVEEHILPRLGERAVILNWSQRSRWGCTLAALAFRYFGGSREFCPLAVVFRPFRFARRFRFYEPFREFQAWQAAAVAKMESDLLELVDGITGTPSS